MQLFEDWSNAINIDIKAWYKMDVSATQAQRDHKIIDAGNFLVQPQDIMGSGIVE